MLLIGAIGATGVSLSCQLIQFNTNLDFPHDGRINSEFSPFLIRSDVNMWNSEDLQQFAKPAATILQQQNHSLVPPSVFDRSEFNRVTIHLYGYKMHTSVVMNSKKTASLQEEWPNMLFCQKSLLLTWDHSIWKDNIPRYFGVIIQGRSVCSILTYSLLKKEVLVRHGLCLG